MPIRSVADAMDELKAGTSKHIRSRAQAVAVGLKAEGKSRTPTKRKSLSTRSLSGGR